MFRAASDDDVKVYSDTVTCFIRMCWRRCADKNSIRVHCRAHSSLWVLRIHFRAHSDLLLQNLPRQRCPPQFLSGQWRPLLNSQSTVTAKETVELSACPVLVKETIAELSVRPVAAVEAVIKLFVLFFAVMILSFGGLLVVLVPLRWLSASPLLPVPPWLPALPAQPWPPALSAPPWHSALPPSLIRLPLHGPGLPSLPWSTSLLNFLDFLWSA